MKPSLDSDYYVFIPRNLTTETEVKEYMHHEFPSFPEPIYNMIQHFYPVPEKSNGLYKDTTGRIAAITGEVGLNCPSYWLAQAFPEDSAYHYEWSSTLPL